MTPPHASLLLVLVALTTLSCQSPSAPVMSHQHHTIDYIEFTVRDLPEAKRFFGAAFGWNFTDYGPDYVGIQRHDGNGEVGGMLAGEPRGGGPLVILYSADLEASVTAVQNAGGTITLEPFDFPGGRRFHFKDPSGNELAVWGAAAE